jgi:predicted transcriptional regulator
MPRSPSPQPTEVEMQILRILWDLGPSPVREIHRQLEAVKGTNYSTTVKMLSVMLQKGLVKRDEKVYNGSAMSLVLQALSSSKATREELDQVRRMLDEMEEK